MSSDSEETQLEVYNNDSRIPCKYGVKCYQKNAQHHSKYKHPPKKETVEQKNKTLITNVKRKNLIKDDNKETNIKCPPRKLQKIHESSERNVHNLSSSSDSDEMKNSDDDEDKNVNTNSETADKDVTIVRTTELNEQVYSSNSAEFKADDNLSISDVDNKETNIKIPPRKLQKTHESSERNVHNLSLSSESNEMKNSDDDEDKNLNTNSETADKDVMVVQTTKLSEQDCSSNSAKFKTDKNLSVSNVDTQKIIKTLFLVEMPKDFYQFFEFCKSISKDNPLLACKSASLKLVGPYDVLKGKIKDLVNEKDKDKYLRHWRYYYDPPEFQTIIKGDNKDGLHFGYWRDDIAERPVFVAKNCGNVSCVFESVAENIFGAVDTYLQGKVKSANPFEKAGIMRLHSQLKNFAKQHNITLEKNTADMRSRERKVVARTFHKAGIVVPYDKMTQLGYRDLAMTNKELQKILKQIEEADTPDKRKMSITQLDEIMRLATIAADECDFGTCLELGHDLFSNGSIHVQGRALQMLTIAYTHLQRPQLLEILQTHLKDRRKGCELSVI